MEFGLLGEVTAHIAGRPVAVGHARQRLVLAALIVDANRVVSVDRLVARVWGVDPPLRARAALNSYVSRLRHALGSAALVRRSGGYVLVADRSAVDVHRFHDLCDRARATTDDVQSAALLTEALGLWRGTALTGLDSQWVLGERDRLHQQRLQAEHDLTDARLRAGHGNDLVAELSTRAAEHPLDERVAGQYMIALYRAGRAADALDHYRQVMAQLADELGTDPGHALQDLHQRILRADPALAEATRTPVATPAQPAASTPPPASPGRNDLPGDVADFAGRADEVDALLDTATGGGSVIISAIDGMGGIGKTALAVHLGHRLVDRYPDAQLFIDLRAHTADAQPLEPSVALDMLLRAFGVSGEQMPADLDDRAALWRAELAGRRVLVVLDNAATAVQVRPLLPGTAGCLALITSRRRLTDLDTSRTFSLDVLQPAAALELFAGIVGTERVSAEIGAARKVIALCGHLPLAIRIAAARLRSRPARTIDDLARRLTDEQRRLSELATGDRSVATVFALSYRDITSEQQRMFRLLGLVPGTTFDARVAAAIANVGYDEAESTLEYLVDAHLLQQPQHGRYRFHDLVRDYARESVHGSETEEQRQVAIGRMLDYYLHVASSAAELVGPSHRQLTLDLTHPPAQPEPFEDKAAALAWFETEYPNLVFAISYSVEHGWDGHAWQFAHATWNYAYLSGYTNEWIRTHQQALVAAERLADKAAEAATLTHLASGYGRVGSLDQVITLGRRALALYREIGDTAGEANCLNNLAAGYVELGRYQEGLDHHLRALELRRAVGDRWNEGHSFYNLGVTYDQIGRYAEAIEHFTLARERYREFGDQRVDAMAEGSIGVTYRKLGRIDDALEHLQHSLRITREIADRTVEIETLNDLGDTWRAAGNPQRAIELHRESLTLNREVNDRHQEGHSHRGIASALESTDPAAAREHWLTALRIYTSIGVPEAAQARDHLAGPSAGGDSA